MKRLIMLFFVLCATLVFTACTERNQSVTETPTPSEILTEIPDVPPAEIDVYEPETLPPFEGKIAIITNSRTGNDEEYDSARIIVEKYYSDKITHVTWPDNFLAEQEQMVDLVVKLGADPDIKAIIVNQAVHGTTAAIEKLREMRKDIFVVCIAPQETLNEITQIANILLFEDVLGMGPAMVQQAQRLGAKTFIHYSYPHHIAKTLFGAHRDLIKETCTELGLKFVDATFPDPSETGIPVEQQFILDDIPKMVDKYGADTAFYAANCAIQAPLIEAIVSAGAIYPQPCCPSPYHGFIRALNIDTARSEWDDRISRWVTFKLPVEDVIAQIKAVLAEEDMLGRVSTWPKRPVYLFTVTAAEYAIKWINGEVPKEGVDAEVLKQLMEDYAGVEVFLTPYTDEYPYTNEGTGQTFDNFLLMRMDYITF